MASFTEIKMLKEITTVEEFTQLVYNMGLQDDETKTLIKEFKEMKKNG